MAVGLVLLFICLLGIHRVIHGSGDVDGYAGAGTDAGAGDDDWMWLGLGLDPNTTTAPAATTSSDDDGTSAFNYWNLLGTGFELGLKCGKTFDRYNVYCC